jgi:hypothetical protein
VPHIAPHGSVLVRVQVRGNFPRPARGGTIARAKSPPLACVEVSLTAPLGEWKLPRLWSQGHTTTSREKAHPVYLNICRIWVSELVVLFVVFVACTSFVAATFVLVD